MSFEKTQRRGKTMKRWEWKTTINRRENNQSKKRRVDKTEERQKKDKRREDKRQKREAGNKSPHNFRIEGFDYLFEASRDGGIFQCRCSF